MLKLKYISLARVYEITVWLLYVCLYKYSSFLAGVGSKSESYFPHAQIILFSIAITIYTIPYYKIIGPKLLASNKVGLLIIVTLLYFLLVSKISNWVVGEIFYFFNQNTDLTQFYLAKKLLYERRLHSVAGWDLDLLFTDIMVLSSIIFVRLIEESKSRKEALEKENLRLQFETLRNRLDPHFLFNSLNTVYSLSVLKDEQANTYILRLSDMMRYLLYECDKNEVEIDSELQFLEDYLELEKKRFKGGSFSLIVQRDDTQPNTIVPFILVQFIENAFKHGSHRIVQDGFVHCTIKINDRELALFISNSMIENKSLQANSEKGIGIKSAIDRLDYFYKSAHSLQIQSNETTYSVRLIIDLRKMSNDKNNHYRR